MGIGAKLSEILKIQQSNPNELAEKIGVAPSTIYSIIKRDNMKVDISVLAKICKELNVKMEVFYNEYIIDSKNSVEDIQEVLTQHEKRLVVAYRNKPEMQPAIDKLLNINDDSSEEYVTVLTAARSSDNRSIKFQKISKEKLELLKNAKPVEDESDL